MSIGLAICTDGPIVIAADGKSYDDESYDYSYDTVKIFKLAKNTACVLAGEGLKGIKEFTEALQAILKAGQKKDVDDIAVAVQQFMSDHRTVWAKYKDEHRSHMTVLIAGFNGNVAKIWKRADDGDLVPSLTGYGAIGQWVNASKHLTIGGASKTNRKKAERLALETISLGTQQEPEDIGGNSLLWYIWPSRVDDKPFSYAGKLKTRYKIYP